MKQRMMLYFGSFNPVHRGHTALAEYVIECGLCDCVALIVSPQSPFKQNDDLLPEFARFEMAEIACSNSKYPDEISASAVEFLLPKPSYTIDTLRFLQDNNGGDMTFSILMGADNIVNIGQWKESEKILSDYDIYVYPRNGYDVGNMGRRVVVLEDAPLYDCTATDIRTRLRSGDDVSQMLCEGVVEYIKEHKLFSAACSDGLTAQFMAEGREYYRRNEWGAALNAFRKVLKEAPDNCEAAEYVKMIEEILSFRYTDIYNP